MTQTLRERQAPLKERYQTDPDSAKATLRVVSSTQGNNPIRVQIRNADGAVWDVGAHPMAAGDGELPCSGDLLLASLAACQEITVRMVATAMGITLDRLDITVEGDMDFRGTMGIDRDTPVGFTAIRVAIGIAADAPADRLERLIQRAERYCVVSATLQNPPVVSTEFAVNG
jgi:uncharacterized OsmC-like protein